MKMPENIFEYAVANKLRFPYKGYISVEDLYDLLTTDLDVIYKNLKREAKKAEEESLLATKTEDDINLAVKIEIVKFIVGKKLAQIEARQEEIANREKKNQILAILKKKQDEDLSSKSVEELQQMLEEL